jgi:hypothetical protein
MKHFSKRVDERNRSVLYIPHAPGPSFSPSSKPSFQKKGLVSSFLFAPILFLSISTTINNNQQQSTTINNNQQQSTTINDNQQQSTTQSTTINNKNTNNQQQTPTINNNQQQSTTIYIKTTLPP